MGSRGKNDEMKCMWGARRKFTTEEIAWKDSARLPKDGNDFCVQINIFVPVFLV